MGYKVKRGSSSTDSGIKDMFHGFFRRLIVTLVIFALIVVAGYFAFQFAYDRFSPFAAAADDVLAWIKVFYAEHGVWATLGLFAAVCIGVWAIGEESRKKDRRKQAVNEMMK
ncbi:hypothetical protein [Jeotgalibacillus proteolyticus]|uniref:Uncharacterized protein n=1 Tax=Jeotgalibacillus proteolyticus TaxID=2082395 RepID=A0A2S5G6S5_9BACL|nr:hypothetical protein [Jeotgalibacillus proteolyticus]PPA68686.1 hypothetical protein C4B60_19130 [Jeotgalibacillus proteolyticus]PPA68763.1 hypothetical protein C4B60_19560 [Jeotgalibacillus proteolyticus]